MVLKNKEADGGVYEFERQLKSKIFNRTNAIIIIADPAGKITFVNPVFKKLTGRTSKEVIGHSVKNLCPTDLWPVVEKTFRKALKPGFIEFECPFLTKKKGEIRIVSLNSAVLRNKSGRVLRVIAIGKDITEHETFDTALKESEAKYSKVIENTTDGITVLQDGLVRFVNAAFARFLGHRKEELIGTPFTKYLTRDEVEQVVKNYKRRLNGKKIRKIYETKLKKKDGTIVPVELNASFGLYEGRPADYVFIRDLTERKKTKAQLKRDDDELTRANKQLIEVKETLEKKISDLERFNRIAVDRELKMIDLKERIRTLEKQLEQAQH